MSFTFGEGQNPIDLTKGGDAGSSVPPKKLPAPPPGVKVPPAVQVPPPMPTRVPSPTSAPSAPVETSRPVQPAQPAQSSFPAVQEQTPRFPQQDQQNPQNGSPFNSNGFNQPQYGSQPAGNTLVQERIVKVDRKGRPIEDKKPKNGKNS